MSEEKSSTINETALAANAAAGKKRERRRFWKRLICGVLLTLAVLLALAVLFRDPLIELGVRHVGSLIVGTPMEIEDFNSSLNGKIELINVSVANPKGYLKPHAFKVGRIYVKLDVGTLLSRQPVVENVEVTGVAVNFEARPDGSSNLTDIQHNLEKFAGEEEPEQPKATATGGSPLIKQLSLTGMTVSISSAVLNTSVPLPLPPVYLSNLGGDRPLGQTLLTVYDGLLNSVGTVGGGVTKGIGVVTNTGKGIGQAVGGAVNVLVDTVKRKK